MRIDEFFNENFRGVDIVKNDNLVSFSDLPHERYIIIGEPFLFVDNQNQIYIARKVYVPERKKDVFVYEYHLRARNYSLPFTVQELSDMQDVLNILMSEKITQTALHKKFGFTITEARLASKYGVIWRHKFRNLFYEIFGA